ncbi:MAG: hypothetical protein M1828_003637 [Chrysothrix sp. TS-e1954]|nr:MAG: hypothetical protein M1828_003637 [Chrysothrix sp. TS-e1954]
MERTSNYGGSGRRALILCFDGTGNKFQGNSADSNIIKIFSMLDHQDPMQGAYYQPGIGTYIEDSALTKTGRIARIRSSYKKAKDQAVGTSFDQHIRGAYHFLMQHYGLDDDLYFFGFSRGAYTARFLAQMLDAVGLLSSGNEEMFRFAWKAFSQWQTRLDQTEEQRKKKKENFEFMRAFRETFSRPVRRVRFMGLFDTVNSVPRFEAAWMRRSKFPYAAKSSSRVVRHAVAIDERRAKFRQNLISQEKPGEHHHLHLEHLHEKIHEEEEHLQHDAHEHHHHRAPNPQKQPQNQTNGKTTKKEFSPGHLKRQTTEFGRFKPRRGGMSLSVPDGNHAATSARTSQASLESNNIIEQPRMGLNGAAADDDDDENAPQDIQEIWFPGCHADIGGGWPLEPGEDMSLSHAPLLWMIREARAAGLPFDEDKLRDAGYIFNDPNMDDAVPAVLTNPTFSFTAPTIPALQLDGERVDPSSPTTPPLPPAPDVPHGADPNRVYNEQLSPMWETGRAHDALEFNQGTPWTGVISWRIMENMPFLRMDLRPDGTWAPIRWPLPRGETRDIPAEAWIHHSAIKRMEHLNAYRPGNLIVGGGGRGVKVAPKDYGMGEWTVLREDGGGVGGVVVRASKPGEKPKDLGRVLTDGGD